MKARNDTSTHNALAITFAPHILTCSWISSIHSRILLRAYKKFPLSHLELEKLIIFNPTRIQTIITEFITAYRLGSIPVRCSLIGPLAEQFISMPTAHPTLNQFPISHAPHWQWNYQYLYPTDHEHMFYLCGIKKPILLQYQLLAINAGLDMQLITSEHNALLQLYRHIFGNAFRNTQLGVDLAKHHSVENLFSHDDLMRTLTIPSHITISHADTIPLLTACGLFISGDHS